MCALIITVQVQEVQAFPVEVRIQPSVTLITCQLQWQLTLRFFTHYLAIRVATNTALLLSLLAN